MRVLVAPDGFKGSLPALQVATAIGQGLEAAGVASRLLPLADGGDGSVAAAVHAGSAPRSVPVRGADGRRHDTEFAFDGTTAVVEVAGTCGPSTLPPGVLAPMTSSSHGFGQAVLTALDAGARRIVLCLGGSASTDGGAGLLAALGVRFRDDAGRAVEPTGGTLTQVAEIDPSGVRDLAGVELVVATDVTNPLLVPTALPPCSGRRRRPLRTRSASSRSACDTSSTSWTPAGRQRPTAAGTSRTRPVPGRRAVSASPAGGSVPGEWPGPTSSSTSSASTPRSRTAPSSSPARGAWTGRPWPGSCPPSRPDRRRARSAQSSGSCC